MTNLWHFLHLSVIGFIDISVSHATQTIAQPTFIRKKEYNVSSVAFTSSLLLNTTGSKNDACYLQCFLTSKCMSFIYNSETTECLTFSGLLDDPPHSTDNLENAYFIQGYKICSEMGYVFEAAIPFCFKIHHDRADYDTAVSNFQNEGARLIQIDSLAKQKIADTFVLKAKVYKYRTGGILVDGTYRFESGVKIPQLYWDVGDPTFNGRARIYLSLFYKSNKWNDVNASAGYGYICERML